MITLLSKIFIKEKGEKEIRKAYGTLCGVIGIVLNVFLFAFKYFAGVISGSIAITADAFNNLSDAGSSFITLVSFWYAGKKPDTEHPFGHGRFEYVSGFVIAMAIFLVGFELLKSSVKKIFMPEPVDTSGVAMLILAVSICVKLYMVYYNKRIGKQINSSAMKATAADSLNDVVATTLVWISMLIMRFCNVNIDGICGIFVAVFILYSGYSAAKDTISPLLGMQPDTELVEKIKQMVMEHEVVLGVHDLVVHDYGPGRVMISLHAEVSGEENIYHIHNEIDIIERELKDELGCEAVIHMDPVEKDNELAEYLKQQMEEYVQSINEKMTIHDFRLISTVENMKLVFDVVVPYSFEMSNEELIARLQQKASEIDKEYLVLVNIDEM